MGTSPGAEGQPSTGRHDVFSLRERARWEGFGSFPISCSHEGTPGQGRRGRSYSLESESVRWRVVNWPSTVDVRWAREHQADRKD